MKSGGFKDLYSLQHANQAGALFSLPTQRVFAVNMEVSRPKIPDDSVDMAFDKRGTVVRANRA